MKIPRRRFLELAAGAAALPAVSRIAKAQAYARLADLGGMMLSGSPVEFGKLIADETEKWAKVVKFSGARAD
jgi:hypothetical protein